jgi:hypothetical protein
MSIGILVMKKATALACVMLKNQNKIIIVVQYKHASGAGIWIQTNLFPAPDHTLVHSWNVNLKTLIYCQYHTSAHY